MNLSSVASPNGLSLHILIEKTESGDFMASIPELTNCIASGHNREAAIEALQEKVKARLLNIEVLTLEVNNNPWINFIGMFEGDEEFAELAAELREERELDVNDAI
jgi:predicted RNase H-like HicB family nuclease